MGIIIYLMCNTISILIPSTELPLMGRTHGIVRYNTLLPLFLFQNYTPQTSSNFQTLPDLNQTQSLAMKLAPIISTRTRIVSSSESNNGTNSFYLDRLSHYFQLNTSAIRRQHSKSAPIREYLLT